MAVDITAALAASSCFECRNTARLKVLEAVLLWEVLQLLGDTRTPQELVTAGSRFADRSWLSQHSAKTLLWCATWAASVGAPIICEPSSLYSDLPCWYCLEDHDAYTVYVYYVAQFASASGVADVTLDGILASSAYPCFACLGPNALEAAILEMLCAIYFAASGLSCDDYGDDQLFGTKVCCQTLNSFIGLWTQAADGLSEGGGVGGSFRLLQDLSYRLLEDGTSRRLLNV